MSYKIDTRKLRKALNELIACVDKLEKEPQQGGHVRGMGGAIGVIGNYLISIDVDEFQGDVSEFAIYSEVITPNKGE